METLIRTLPEYSLYKIDAGELNDTIRFVVETNYLRHQGELPPDIEKEIEEICEKEQSHLEQSFFLVAKENTTKKIIGSIRIAQWNGTAKQIQECPLSLENRHLFHIGRLAVSAKGMRRASVILFKELITRVLNIAYSNINSIVFAELDRKLGSTIFRVESSKFAA
ncbi:MAG: hypothetical protein LBU90_07310 [Bacteroidales bacterium]|jgi:hypothetical protein|nr:hypothetical protein [Bacteroidales bacterium]